MDKNQFLALVRVKNILTNLYDLAFKLNAISIIKPQINAALNEKP
jgi:hypothetical protein